MTTVCPRSETMAVEGMNSVGQSFYHCAERGNAWPSAKPVQRPLDCLGDGRHADRQEACNSLEGGGAHIGDSQTYMPTLLLSLKQGWQCVVSRAVSPYETETNTMCA